MLIAACPAAAKAGEWSGPPLAHKARAVALHGGITGTCYGCATGQMKLLMRKVYEARFAEEGVYAQRTAVCLMESESGGNPGAISSTGDYGGPQMNRWSHERGNAHWWRPGRGFRYLIFDPWFAASQMWAMSSKGRSWSAWTGTYGRGICR